MRAGRLISLVSILGREGRTTAGVLAQRLEVSERTILRDLEVLSGSGVPVYAVRGPGGGFQLLEGYSPTLPADAWLRPASRRGGSGRMTVRITSEGRRVAAILGYLQPLRLRPADGEDPDRGWVTATCRMRSVSSMAVEVLALGPHVEVLAPGDLRDHVAELARRTSALYG
ncbi:MAG TPA: HTH domain-containing protein [Nocardioides sp.]|nr:HTH domain-containing protein [Nocardioides sp.]